MNPLDPTQPLEVNEPPSVGAPEGNQNALKFDTAEKRQSFCKAYCEHRRKGFSKESFSFEGSGKKVFEAYLVKYPIDFPTDMIDDAETANLRFWEGLGISGTQGMIKNYNSDSWKFNMSNRFKWKMREDVTTDDKELNITIKRDTDQPQ